MHIVTIDTGTTNTRVVVWRGAQRLAAAERPVGARETAITGSRSLLQSAVALAIQAALADAKLPATEVGAVIATGMISSSLGLVEVPHLSAPAGIAELAAGMRAHRVPAVWPQPIWFVPGVRNRGAVPTGLTDCEAADMMRGEEVEVAALIGELPLRQPTLVILPGSHTKFVAVNAQQQIAASVTTLSGELLDTLSHHTILAGAVDGGYAQTIDEAALLAGAQTALDVGLSRACFVVRTLDQYQVAARNARANFLLGAVLATDLQALQRSRAWPAPAPTHCVVTGRKLLRDAFGVLCARLPWSGDAPFASLTIIDDAMQQDLSGRGARMIAAARGVIQ